MAFVFRSERIPGFGEQKTADPGPGAYIGHSDFRPRHISNAPFASRSERNIGPAGAYAPGPGYYQPADQFGVVAKKVNDQDSKSTLLNNDVGIFSFLKAQPVAFNTRVERFKNEETKQLPPGPGFYNPSAQEALQKKRTKHQPRAEWQQMAMVRLPNAPSIPSHNNVYGYEETNNGELVQQQNPEKVFAGQGADTIGPGHYELKRELGDRKRGANWHASNVRRLNAETNKTADGSSLGPGAYEVANNNNNVTSVSQYRPRGTSCFASRVPRTKALGMSLGEGQRAETADDADSDSDEADIEDATPGPGYYNPRNNETGVGFRNTQGQQQFGTSAPRFPKPQTTATETLGPGQYGDFRRSYKYQRRKATAAFCTSSGKKVDRRESAKTPGPGHYVAKDMHEMLNKKVWGKQGVFGSTERRFAQLTAFKTPGPGFYNAELARKELDQKAPIGESSMFRPPLKLSKKRPEVVPEIGKYDQSMNTIQANLQKKREKVAQNPLQANLKLNKQLNKSANERFPAGKADEHEKYLGPGCYDMPREFDRPNIEAKGNLLVSKDQRFRQEPKIGPGPGYYVSEDNNLWRKRTYNLLFNNEQ